MGNKNNSLFFDLNRSQKVWIYGAGEQGEIVTNVLKRDNIPVGGIFDQNAENISCISNIPVWNPAKCIELMDEEDILIITLNNGMMHEKIAYDFFLTGGYNKIIFLPMTIKMSDEKKHLMRRAYASIIRGSTNITRIPLFTYDEITYRLIDDTDINIISFWYPINKIFTRKTCEKNVTQWFEAMDKEVGDKVFDIPVQNAKIYKELITYITTGKGNIDDYLKFQGCSRGRKSEDVIESRKELFNIYNREFDYNSSFFSDSPCTAYWDDIDNVLRVTDGLHRIHFLISKGMKEAPVCMEISDYKKMIELKQKDGP